MVDSVYQIWRKSGQRNCMPDIVAGVINRGHDIKTSLMAGFGKIQKEMERKYMLPVSAVSSTAHPDGC